MHFSKLHVAFLFVSLVFSHPARGETQAEMIKRCRPFLKAEEAALKELIVASEKLGRAKMEASKTLPSDLQELQADFDEAKDKYTTARNARSGPTGQHCPTMMRL